MAHLNDASSKSIISVFLVQNPVATRTFVPLGSHLIPKKPTLQVHWPLASHAKDVEPERLHLQSEK